MDEYQKDHPVTNFHGIAGSVYNRIPLQRKGKKLDDHGFPASRFF